VRDIYPFYDDQSLYLELGNELRSKFSKVKEVDVEHEIKSEA
jgi:hypothetical protein